MSSEKLFTPAPSPESVGIPSQAILNFLQRIDAERIGMHGFLLVRRNQIAAEGYWSPWSAERKHRMYSISKSFVALAVGLMIDEGRLTLVLALLIAHTAWHWMLDRGEDLLKFPIPVIDAAAGASITRWLLVLLLLVVSLGWLWRRLRPWAGSDRP